MSPTDHFQWPVGNRPKWENGESALVASFPNAKQLGHFIISIVYSEK
jgi:hypothetical protein